MAGKLKRYCRAVLCVAIAVPVIAFSMQAEEAPDVVDGAELASEQNVEVEIDLALIEFLGQWETDDGEWLAPSDLADETFVELIDAMESWEIEEID